MELVKNSTTNIHQEWRTPPLWGVAISAPYLHDGRAETLEQAIQWHGGEGQRAAEAFRSLKPDERSDLIQFLQSLSAPGNDQVVMPARFEQLNVRGRSGGGGRGFF
jgi:cytochrome c peroxidase